MKTKAISAVMILLLLLCACTKSPKSVPNESIVYGETDTSGINAVYISNGSGLFPIALTANGVSQLTGENYYYNVSLTTDAEPSLTEKQLTAFDTTGKNLGTLSRSKADLKAFSADPYTVLFTSGNWMLSPDSIRYESYDKGKAAGDGYKQFIFESFPEHFTAVSDVGITEIAEYDIDGDGANDALIHARGDSYNILAAQSPTLGSSILASDFTQSKSYTAQCFLADIDGDGTYSLITVSGDSFKTVCVYKHKSLEKDYTVYLPLEKHT